MRQSENALEVINRVKARLAEIQKTLPEGVKIVTSCGFDSIPHDFGAYYTLQALRRRMSESEAASTPVCIEGFLRSRGTISGGTWHSAVTAMRKAVNSHGESQYSVRSTRADFRSLRSIRSARS